MDEKQREKGILKTSIVGIGGNVVLVIIKSIIGLLAGSVSIVMDALNNLTDALSSIITIVGTKLSSKKPDKKHPFGYGRIEYITSAVIGIIILFAGGAAIYESILSIIDYFKEGTMPSYNGVSLIIIGVAVFIKVILGLIFKNRGKKYNSDALSASGTDALFDSLLSTGTLIGAIISNYLHFYVEGYIGIIIGLFILKSGVEVIKGAVTYIIGGKFDEELAHKIKDEISHIDGVLGAYDLILNNYGYNRYIGSVHIGVKDDISAKEIQEIERQVNTIAYTKYNIIMTTGIYAENTSSPISKEIKEKIMNIIKDHPTILQMHGFYLDDVKQMVNFDLVISYDEKDTNSLLKLINDELTKSYPQFYFYINVDRDY